MNLEEFARNDGRLVREYDYDDGRVMAVDMGVGSGDFDVDVVGDTVIVYADDEQYDVEVPGGAEKRAFIKNGVLTIEVTEA